MPAQPFQMNHSVVPKSHFKSNKSRIARIINISSLHDEETISLKKLFLYVSERINYLMDINQESVDIVVVYQELDSCLRSLINQSIKICAQEDLYLNRLARSIAGMLLCCLCEEKIGDNFFSTDVDELKIKLFQQFYYLEITKSSRLKVLDDERLKKNIDDMLLKITDELSVYNEENFIPQQFTMQSHIVHRRDLYAAWNCSLVRKNIKQNNRLEAAKTAKFVDWERIDEIYWPDEVMLGKISESTTLSNLVGLNLQQKFIWLVQHCDEIGFSEIEEISYGVFKSTMTSERELNFIGISFSNHRKEKEIKLIKSYMKALSEIDPAGFIKLYYCLDSKNKDLFYDLSDEIGCTSRVVKNSISLMRALYQLTSSVFHVSVAVLLLGSCQLDSLPVPCDAVIAEKILASGEEKYWQFVFENAHKFKDFSLINILQFNLESQWSHELVVEKMIAEPGCQLKITTLDTTEAIKFINLIFNCAKNNTKLLARALQTFFIHWHGYLSDHLWGPLLRDDLDLIIELVDVINWEKSSSLMNFISSRLELSCALLEKDSKNVSGENYKKLIQFLLARENIVDHISDDQLLKLLNVGVDASAILKAYDIDNPIYMRLLYLILIRSDLLSDVETVKMCNVSGIVSRMSLTFLVDNMSYLYTHSAYARVKILFGMILATKNHSDIEQVIYLLKIKNYKISEICSYLYLVQKDGSSVKISYDLLQDLLNTGPCGVLRILPLEIILLAIEHALFLCQTYIPILVEKFNKIPGVDAVKKWYLFRHFVLVILQNETLLENINQEQYSSLIVRLIALTASNPHIGQSADEFYSEALGHLRKLVLKSKSAMRTVKYFLAHINNKVHAKSTVLVKLLQNELISSERKFFTDDFLEIFIDESDCIVDDLLQFVVDYAIRVPLKPEQLEKILRLLHNKPEYILLLRKNKLQLYPDFSAQAMFVLLQQDENKYSFILDSIFDETEVVIQKLVSLVLQNADFTVAIKLIQIFSSHKKHLEQLSILIKLLIHSADLDQVFIAAPKLLSIIHRNWNLYLCQWYGNDKNHKTKLSILKKLLSAKAFYSKENVAWKMCFYDMLNQACVCGLTANELFDLLLQMDGELSREVAGDLLFNWQSYKNLWLCPRTRANFLLFLYHSKWFYKHALNSLQPKDLINFKEALGQEMLNQAILPSEISVVCRDIVWRGNAQGNKNLHQAACHFVSLLQMQSSSQRYAADSLMELDYFMGFIKEYCTDEKLAIREKSSNLLSYFHHIQTNDASQKSQWNIKVLSLVIKDPRYFYEMIYESKPNKSVDFTNLVTNDLEDALYAALYTKNAGQTVLSVKQNLQINNYLQQNLKNKHSTELLYAHKSACVKQQRITSKFSWFWKFAYDNDILNWLDSGDEYFAAVSRRLRLVKQNKIKVSKINNHLQQENIYPSPLKVKNAKAINDPVLASKRLEYK